MSLVYRGLSVFVSLAVLACLIGPAQAKENCRAYLQILDQPYTVRSVENASLDRCSLYERIIIDSSSYREFAFEFSNRISDNDYPVYIFRALNQIRRGNVASAILNLDVSISSVSEIFTKLGDRERAKLYSFLIVKLRNKALARVISDSSFLDDLEQISEPELTELIDGAADDVAKTISCLITLDSLQVPFETLGESISFNTCLKGAEDG